jgi:hypothetical protein
VAWSPPTFMRAQPSRTARACRYPITPFPVSYLCGWSVAGEGAGSLFKIDHTAQNFAVAPRHHLIAERVARSWDKADVLILVAAASAPSAADCRCHIHHIDRWSNTSLRGVLSALVVGEA